MDLSAFYSLMAVTSFTLVGLWWTVVERHPEWKAAGARRRLAGGVYLSFLLPGLMSTFAQIDPSNPLIWRVSFGLTAAFGMISTLTLVQVDRSTTRGPFRRHRWVVALLYLLILVLGVFPAAATLIGFTPLQAASLALIALIVLGHGLAWEFMMEPEPQTSDGSPSS